MPDLHVTTDEAERAWFIARMRREEELAAQIGMESWEVGERFSCAGARITITFDITPEDVAVALAEVRRARAEGRPARTYGY